MVEMLEDPAPHQKNLQTIGRAVRERREVEFYYRSLRNPEARQHAIRPYGGLELREGHIYFSGCVVPSGQDRDYRLDRIVPGSARLLPQKYVPSPRRQKPLRLRYRLSAQIAAFGATPRFPGHREERQEGGDVIVTAEIGQRDLFWASKTLLKYGEHCVVLEPPELVAEMKRIVEQMGRNYGLLP